MKRWLALALILFVSMAPFALGEGQEETDDGTAAHDSFQEWLGQTLGFLSDRVQDGWNQASTAVTEGTDRLQAQLSAWILQGETYLRESGMDAEIARAWDTLTAGAAAQGQATLDSVQAAYAALQEWTAQAGEDISQGMQDVIDSLGAAAGITEARIAHWYHVMESYMTQHAQSVTEDVKAAWEIIREQAAQAGQCAGDSLREACETIRTWIEGEGETVDPVILEGLDALEGTV